MLSKLLDFLLLRLMGLRVRLLSPRENDVVFIQHKNVEQVKRLVYEIDRVLKGGVAIIGLENKGKIEFLRDAPEEMKERIRDVL